MKFLLLFVFVAAVTMIDARPSKGSDPSTRRNEEMKEALKISNQVERSKKHIHRTQYPGWETSSINVAQASASVHSNSGNYHHHSHHHSHHHQPHYSTSHSEAHGFAANVNLPHSSLSIAQSEAHQQQQIFG